MEFAYWLFWISLAVAVVSGVLGFLVLRTVNRGFFKVIFYTAVAAAFVFWFGWFFSGPPASPVPPLPI